MDAILDVVNKGLQAFYPDGWSEESARECFFMKAISHEMGVDDETITLLPYDNDLIVWIRTHLGTKARDVYFQPAKASEVYFQPD